MVERWRERWAEHVNERLAELDIDARIDYRSLEAQGIRLEPQSQIGAPAQRIEGEGLDVADRAELHRQIARNNGDRIIADPSVALDAITHQQSTFTRREMGKFAHRHSDGIDQFNEVMGAMRNAPDLVELGQDGRGDLIDRWDRQRQASPDSSRIILTHTNAEVRELDEAARDRMREAGDLGEDVRVTVERGERNFAAGDRVMFLQNERGLGVKNGTLGTIEQVSAQGMSVQADDGRSIAFDFKDYVRIDHGYAATIHKAQGMTVDRTHVLATPGMDAHGSYVALSRHRDGMYLHYGRDDFAGQDRLINTLSRDRAKDKATDYEQQIDPAQDYAERRGITFRARVAQIMRRLMPERVRDAVDDMLDRLRAPGDGVPGPEPGTGRESIGKPVAEQQIGEDADAALRRVRGRAFVRHARAVDAIFKGQAQDMAASPGQVQELHEARAAFNDLRPHGSQDAEAVYKRNPGFAADVASGDRERAMPARHAVQREAEMRQHPELRADRFVERFRELQQTGDRQYAVGNYSGYKVARKEMGNMAMSLERDAQMESLLETRKKQLGIDMDFDAGMRLWQQLSLSHGLGRGRSIGL